jgi:hypothetical protein
MYGLTRGTMTLIGAATAGLLLWLGSQMDADSLGGYWTWIGLLAAAGLVMALSQLLGGWTKWGWPRLTAPVFLLAFLPALIVGGLVLLHAQPEEAFGQAWAADFGLDGFAEDLTAVLPALAFGLGLLFGFTFDTTGPRRLEHVDEADGRDVRRRGYAGPVPVDAQRAADEPVAAERAHSAPHVDRDGDGVDDRERAPAEARGDRDADGMDDRDQVSTGARVDRDGDGVDDRTEATTVRRPEDGHRR